MSNEIKIMYEKNQEIKYPLDYNSLINQIYRKTGINNPILLFTFKKNNGESIIKEIENEEDYQKYKNLYEKKSDSIEIKIKNINNESNNEASKDFEGRDQLIDLEKIIENQSKKIKKFENDLIKIQELQTEVQFLTKQIFKINQRLSSKKENEIKVKNSSAEKLKKEFTKKNEEKTPEKNKNNGNIILNNENIKIKGKTPKNNETTLYKEDNNKDLNNNISNINNYNIDNFDSNIYQKEKKNYLSCKFFKNKEIIIRKSLIKENFTIHHKIKVFNDGMDNLCWPEDTFIRCINDDSEIYFYHSNDKEIQIKNQNTIFFLYKVIILFKNYYNIQEGKYTLNYQLISDFFGNIGNETGYLTVIVTK
jgi:hypothetical protein